MTFGAAATIVGLATVAAGTAATHPLELRAFRWLKIALSLPLVVLLTSAFYDNSAAQKYFALWSVGFLGLIWKSPLAHLGSAIFMRLLNGDWNAPGGIQANISGAKAMHAGGDVSEAIAFLEIELEKEPLHYEGLLLLAGWHEELGQREAAVRALEKILRSGALTREQRAFVFERYQNLRELIDSRMKIEA